MFLKTGSLKNHALAQMSGFKKSNPENWLTGFPHNFEFRFIDFFKTNFFTNTTKVQVAATIFNYFINAFTELTTTNGFKKLTKSIEHKIALQKIRCILLVQARDVQSFYLIGHIAN